MIFIIALQGFKLTTHKLSCAKRWASIPTEAPRAMIMLRVSGFKMISLTQTNYFCLLELQLTTIFAEHKSLVFLIRQRVVSSIK